MKAGLSMKDLAVEIQRQKAQKKDFVAATPELTYKSNGRSLLTVGTQGSFEVTGVAHGQVADRLHIPKRFYDLMRQKHPALLDHNVNELFRATPERRMVRTLDGKARAFLSDRYRRIDNWAVAESILPSLGEAEATFPSCQVTENRMYIKALFPGIRAAVKVGDEVQAGVVIQNSETGQGSFSVSVLVYRLVCKNGMISASALRRSHVGGHVGTDGDVAELFQDDTLKADDKALMLKMRDVVKAAMDQAQFETIVRQMREAAEGNPIENPVKAVEVLADVETFTDTEKASVLHHLVTEGDLSRYGLMNAVTRTSQDLGDYDRATDFEKLGGRILDLDESKWMAMAEAN